MNYPKLREELIDYYWNKANDRADVFYEKCTPLLDSRAYEGMSVYDMKLLQYRTITEEMDPVVFLNSPFYYETGTLSAHCDGAADFRGHKHPGGWTYRQNQHLFEEFDTELWDKRCKQGEEMLYLICGPFNDVFQHFSFNHRPVLEGGLSGIYSRAQNELKNAQTEKEKEFLNAVCEGLLCIKRISEKFAEKAEALLETACNDTAKTNLQRIADCARRTPWEKPESFYEALNTLAFCRKVLGALEGVGFNSFGRVDLDLYPFYKKDIENGKITEAQAYQLVCEFLITFDCHYDHDMIMAGYADHELENTYVLGGCDAEGNPLYNELTRMFLQATREEKIIYPKIKCRFSANSPKEYLDEINSSVIKGTSTILYQNDDAVIPALLKTGKPLEEARDYVISGCWDLKIHGKEKPGCGAYVNMLKAFEFSLHKLTEKQEKVGLNFAPIDNAQSFEDVYQITCDNINKLFTERAAVSAAGGNMWDKVDVLPLFSSTLDNCLESRKDFTAGGARYRDDVYLCFGFPNIVDSLLAIKELCFDSRQYTLAELLNAIRSNWEGFEEMRKKAMKCHGWGDGSEEACSLANRFNNDLFGMLDKLSGTHGGKIRLGHLTYTEIRWWGEKTLATPDGRKNGEYFAQGLTPSRLKKIPSVTSVINTLSSIDKTTLGGNSVVNIILPSNGMSLDICEAFLRAVANTAVQSLQLNCTSKEELLDAQKHPENYPDLIVRVTGFSAKFTSLSPEWQQEVITRNFYE
ncbi:MAG: hypothetical protein IKD04_01930 [Clostridia bacterium]|nr:hypothetical protein [Clostridia bacterium]